MAAINFDFIRQKELSQTKHRPENVGAVITLVLFYKNRRDET